MLREFIAANKYNWTVDPRLRDTDPLPQYPRGGKSDVNPPANTIAVKNVAEYLGEQQPPANPFLRERWHELKFLKPHKPAYPTGSPTDVVASSKPAAKKEKKGKKQ